MLDLLAAVGGAFLALLGSLGALALFTGRAVSQSRLRMRGVIAEA